MDGGRGVLRSIAAIFATPKLYPQTSPAFTPHAPPKVAFAPLKTRHQHWLMRWLLPTMRLKTGTSHRLFAYELLFALLIMITAAGYGAVQSGAYATFIAQNGTPLDMLARAFGFGLSDVRILGQSALSREQILAAAGITAEKSLLFLDAAAVRAKLEAVPMIAHAGVRKLYPDHLEIEISERAPFALWQSDDKVFVTAADGTVIEPLDNRQLADLPFVVGVGANAKTKDYLMLLQALEELRPKVRAGIWVAGRRWSLKFQSGLEVKLPEQNPQQAIAQLVRAERETRLLEKDIVLLDLRYPGRIIARLSTDSADARAQALAKSKQSRSGG